MVSWLFGKERKKEAASGFLVIRAPMQGLRGRTSGSEAGRRGGGEAGSRGVKGWSIYETPA